MSLEATPGLVRSYVAPGFADFLGRGEWLEEQEPAFAYRPDNTVRELRCTDPPRHVIDEIVQVSSLPYSALV